MNPFLSIIIPIYNVENYISTCIESILSQTFRDFELILVDDGSPDNSPAICNEYAQKDNRIKVIHKENGGLVSARKAGIEVARGEYIGFIDGDDWIKSTVYETLCHTAKKYEVDIVTCDLIFSYEHKEIKYKENLGGGLYNKENLLKSVYPVMIYYGGFYEFGVYPSVCNKIFRRELVMNNIFNIDNLICMGEDAVCTYMCLLDANSIYILDNQHLYYYRQTESSMTKGYDAYYFDRIRYLIETLYRANVKKQVYDIDGQMDYYISFLVTEGIHNEMNIENTKTIASKIQFIADTLSQPYFSTALSRIKLKNIPMKQKILLYLLKYKMYHLMIWILVIKNVKSRYLSRHERLAKRAR